MSSGRARWGSPTGRRCWDVTTRREGPWRRRPRRREELWKRRGVEKSERRLSHPAWKSRKVRGIPTFPQLRRRLVKLLHRTYHVLQKADILTCYEQSGMGRWRTTVKVGFRKSPACGFCRRRRVLAFQIFCHHNSVIPAGAEAPATA